VRGLSAARGFFHPACRCHGQTLPDGGLSSWLFQVPSYLPGAVGAFDPVEFIHYCGVDAFKADWPRLRHSVEAGAVHCLPLFDLAWSRLVSGTWNAPPDERIASLPARKRDFLVAVARKPGASIYAISSVLGMQYKRAHEHARDLCEAGLLRMQPSVETGRMRHLLFPTR